ncbi:hypothetical protein [Petrotoga halophila]|uniref:Uncharacterized protein n=1 Tax=Petrotoga halophila DSM 16923 TaxID=1122953 RepID=A0A2S5EB73_9BACT|nr:hypothetical protein [Petrotoga halophila]POZ90396.1 hypothetical protein AA81_11560 [Petrotoga halophila DSM 16923]
MNLFKSGIFIILIILIIILSFSSQQVTVAVYLTVPEFLRITNLSKESLQFTIDMSSNQQVFGDKLSFEVHANVDYLLGISFNVEEDLSEAVKTLIEETYESYITDNSNNLVTNAESIPTIERDKGIQDYWLFFEMDMRLFSSVYLPEFEGYIGDVEITVSKL